MTTQVETSYDIEGRLLEVCTCEAVCPCWVGLDPDGGTCESILAWAVDRGTIKGVDVSDRIIGVSVHIPGNVFAGNWSAVVYVDDRTSQEQQEALLSVFTGQLGGQIADLVALIGDVRAVERVPITCTVEDGAGQLLIGDVGSATVEPLVGATGEPTTLHDSVFTSIPGSPAFVGTASSFRRAGSAHGLADVETSGRNAIQGSFRFTG
ncbi:MAG: DUF1326 domain-containing protein [Intrasporangium sp.]|uniref:DUF1326 domain-containing protein n=1 Tax=Intrasporangium sp. TaxID=1925024 RepID=UPI0026483608|nr:DUF1326 domain-containing protein [Intrasporangium sp.]MDN5796680.1 DUF1326 domain-containing protein [Intrasporangium sp.]